MNESYESVGRSFGCSGSTIKNVIKRFGIKIEQRRRINENEHFNKQLQLKDRPIHFCMNCGCEIVDKSYHNRIFCSNKCQGEYKSKSTISEWLNHPEKFKSPLGYLFIRDYLKKIHDNKCELCGWGKENEYTGIVPLQVHHINGDCTDNHIENLQLLCPNCHSLTENFGSRNRGNSTRNMNE